MISKHSAHSSPLPDGFRTWLWRNTCLLLLILMLWHRQAVFESKGDKLSSSAEYSIRTTVSGTECRRETNWGIKDEAKKLELNSPSLWLSYQKKSAKDLMKNATCIRNVWLLTYQLSTKKISELFKFRPFRSTIVQNLMMISVKLKKSLQCNDENNNERPWLSWDWKWIL